MDYDRALERGRTLLTRSEQDQWELAELTHTVLVADGRSLRKWAADLGVSKTHVARLRDVWIRYGGVPDQGHRRTFAEYYTLADVPKDRADEIEREAEETGEGVDRIRRKGRPRDRIEQARELFADRRGMRDALRDADVRERFRQIYEREFGRPQRREDEPVDRAPKHQLVSELVAFGDRINGVVRRLLRVRLGREDREALLDTVGELENSLARMRSSLESDGRARGRPDRKPKADAAPPPEVEVKEESADVPVPDKPARERPPRRTPRVHPPGDRKGERSRTA
ncbi:MAG: hypothetical protein WD770_09720 [Actinomycetota bacterium]